MGKPDFEQLRAVMHAIDALDAAHKAALDADAQFLAHELGHCLRICLNLVRRLAA